MTINTSHANITGGITNDILNILDITDSLYTNDTLDTIDIYYTRGKLIPYCYNDFSYFNIAIDY